MIRSKNSCKPSQPSEASMSSGGTPISNPGRFVCFISGLRFILPEAIQGVRGVSYAGIPSFGKQFLDDNEDHEIQTMTSEVLKEAYKVYINLRFPDDTLKARNKALAKAESDTAAIFLCKHDQRLKKLRGVTAVGSLVPMSPRPELESPSGEPSFNEQERVSEPGELPDPNQRVYSPPTIAPAACSSYSYVLRNDRLTTVVRKATPDESSSVFGGTTTMGTGTSKEHTENTSDKSSDIFEKPSEFQANFIAAGALPTTNEPDADYDRSNDAKTLCMPQLEYATAEEVPLREPRKPHVVDEPDPKYDSDRNTQALTDSTPNLDTTEDALNHEPAITPGARPALTERDTSAEPGHAIPDHDQDQDNHVGDGKHYNYYGDGRNASTSVYGQNRDVFSALEDILNAQLSQLDTGDKTLFNFTRFEGAFQDLCTL
ncbi:MAG: hypothetical protein M1836_004625 [Candelina mexicana]|nr:MAG: hypothetical protein M1836_004625 [Candelina mexicana]